MLYINGELLNTRNVDPQYKFRSEVDQYHETISDLRKKYGDIVRIQTRQKLQVDPITKYPKHPAAKGLLLQASIATDDGVQEWIYSPTTLTVENGQVKLKEPNLLIHKGEAFIDLKRTPDLAFYCVHTKKVGLNHNSNAKFHIVDLEGISMEQATQRRREGKMMNLIYSAIPENNLRTLAKSWGISGVDGKNIEIVRTELEDKILKDEKSKSKGGKGFRGIDDFINSSEVNFYDQVAAMVRDAEEKGVLLYKEDTRKWVIDYQDSKTPYIVKELASGEFQSPTESLITFLVAENEKLVMVERALGKQVSKPKAKEASPAPEEFPLTIEDIQQENGYAKLRSWAIKYVPEFKVVKGVNVDNLKEALMAKYAMSIG